MSVYRTHKTNPFKQEPWEMAKTGTIQFTDRVKQGNRLGTVVDIEETDFGNKLPKFKVLFDDGDRGLFFEEELKRI